MKREVKLESEWYVKDPEALKGKAALFIPSHHYKGNAVIIYVTYNEKRMFFSF